MTEHPGAIVKRRLKEHGWTQRDFARSIDVSESFLSDFIHGNRGLSATMAMQLSAALGESEDWWMHRYVDYQVARHNAGVSPENRIEV
jgi:addiction module HigA family antidote